MNDPGREVVAIRPPASPPSPMPRFITTRCIAKATGRFSGGVSPAISVDCAGQKAPLPMPIVAEARKPCQCSWMNGYWRKPSVRKTSATPSMRPAADPVHERARNRPGDEADRGVGREDEADRAEPEAAHVVQVDEGEGQHDAVPERVHEPARLERLHRAREARVEAAEVAGHRNETVPVWTSCSTRVSRSSTTAASAPARAPSSRSTSGSSASSSGSRSSS